VNLPPLPPVNSVAFAQGAPGQLSQLWNQYLSSLDLLIRAKTPTGRSLPPIPPQYISVITPESGSPTQPWALYWRARDGALRASGWKVGQQMALQVLKPLPPTVGFAMVFAPSGVLAQPWAQYQSSVDALARPQS
jgi:hypothetical protein